MRIIEFISSTDNQFVCKAKHSGFWLTAIKIYQNNISKGVIVFQVHSLFTLSNNVLCTREMLEHVGHLITAQMSGVDDDDACRPQYVYTGKPHGVKMQRHCAPLNY